MLATIANDGVTTPRSGALARAERAGTPALQSEAGQERYFEMSVRRSAGLRARGGAAHRRRRRAHATPVHRGSHQPRSARPQARLT